ncbi:MAG: hypothetical protein DA405_02140 [Bacteroidetes bacterium]|nr:MAG: hypothetical protein DA405_02140 [Bacteroidota bacterium]
MLKIAAHFFTIQDGFMNRFAPIIFSKVSCYFTFLTIVNSIIFKAGNEVVNSECIEDILLIIVDRK